MCEKTIEQLLEENKELKRRNANQANTIESLRERIIELEEEKRKNNQFIV